MKTSTLLATLLSFTLIYSCAKEDQPEHGAKACQLRYNVIVEEGAASDSFNYQYNGAGQLIKVTSDKYDYTLQYDAGRVVGRKYFYAGSGEMFASDTVLYNPGGIINEIKRVDPLGFAIQTTGFTYNSNKLTALSFFNEKDELKAKYNYTYTINNITAIAGDESWDNINRSFSYKFTYDTRSNNNKWGQQALLYDGFLSDHMGLSVIYAISDNYVKTIEQNGLTVPVSYTIDGNNNTTAITVAGQPVMRGAYNCP